MALYGFSVSLPKTTTVPPQVENGNNALYASCIHLLQDWSATRLHESVQHKKSTATTTATGNLIFEILSWLFPEARVILRYRYTAGWTVIQQNAPKLPEQIQSPSKWDILVSEIELFCRYCLIATVFLTGKSSRTEFAREKVTYEKEKDSCKKPAAIKSTN